MAFIEEQFPDQVSYGSSGGPGFDPKIIETDSGQFQIIVRRTQALRRFEPKEEVRSLTALTAVRDFYLAIGGVGVGFRYKDWSDYTTGTGGIVAHSYDDEIIGTGDGTEDEFALKKTYTQGIYTHTRTILKPVSGTVRVSLDDTELPANIGGTDYTFATNTATGIVTITPAPAAALVVKAGCEFDTPVIFGPSVAKLLSISIDFFEGGNIPELELLEILNPTPRS